MRNKTVAWLVLLVFLQTAHGESLFDDPQLNRFVADLVDKNDTRHYILTSKQLAIHKWLIQDCMHNLGFKDEESSNPSDWSQALHGKYAYCQDHHIPGIDPPCPAEDIVELSVNSSCWKQSFNQIDWSHGIRHVIKKDLPNDQWRVDPFDPAIGDIESEWSSCMLTNGYSYETRVDMYRSFGAATDLSAEAQAALPNQVDVKRSAEECFESTNYYNRRSDLADTRRKEYIVSQKEKLEVVLLRYEEAERHADEKIQQLCKLDSDTIVTMYEQEKYTDKVICMESR